MIKLLIVEDDKNISKMLETTVSIAGYKSDVCYDGQTAVEKINKNHYDLVLLDIMLPNLNGFQVMENIDSEKTPVIFLTAMQDVTDKVKGLKLGAEDYIVKPFEAVELLARIEVILRRRHKKDIIKYGDIVADISRHSIKRQGKEITLTPKEFDLSVFFMQNPDIVLTREQLLSAIWGYEYMGETRTIDTHVQQIRKKLSWQDSLVTVHKLGYRLESR